MHKAIHWLLGLAALGQATLLVLSQRGAVASALEQAGLFDQRPEPDPNYEAAALRSLPPLAARIPLDARVLLVSQVVIPIQYEIHFLPRRFALLLAFPQELVDLARGVSERTHWECQVRREVLVRRQILYSEARLLEELQRADFVVFFFDPPALPLPDVPVRQWVLSLPYRIRFLLGYDPELLTHVRRIFTRPCPPTSSVSRGACTGASCGS